MIRGSVILRVANTKKGLPGGDVSGAFFFCLGFSCIARFVSVPTGSFRLGKLVKRTGVRVLYSS